jgi:hypothetical protein
VCVVQQHGLIVVDCLCIPVSEQKVLGVQLHTLSTIRHNT